MITHWDDVEPSRRERGHIAASWQSLTGANSITTGVQRISVDPGGGRPRCISRARRRRSSTCSRAVGSRCSGTAKARRRSRSGRATASSTSRSSTRTRSARATTASSSSPSGSATMPANTLLPRAGVSWLGSTWVLQGAPEDHPWTREAAVGPSNLGGARGAAAAHRQRRRRAPTAAGDGRRDRASAVRGLGDAAGSERVGLSHYVVQPGMLMNPPHVHSAEEEIFVVLEGSGTVMLYPSPRDDGEIEEFPFARVARSRDPREPSGRTRSGQERTG